MAFHARINSALGGPGQVSGTGVRTETLAITIRAARREPYIETGRMGVA